MNHLYLFLRRVLIVFLVSTFTFVSSFTGNAIADVSGPHTRNVIPEVSSPHDVSDPNIVRPFINSCTLKRLQTSDVVQPDFENPPFIDADRLVILDNSGKPINDNGDTLDKSTFVKDNDGKPYYPGDIPDDLEYLDIIDNVVTLRSAEGYFTISGNGKGEDIEYPGYLYAAEGWERVPDDFKVPEDDQEGDQGYSLPFIDFDPEDGFKLVKRDFGPRFTPPVIEVSPSSYWENPSNGQVEILDNSLKLNLINDLPVKLQSDLGKLPQTKENLESVSQYTNMHYHGFNVSPLLGGDDVLVEVPSNVTPIPVEEAGDDRSIPVPPLGKSTPSYGTYMEENNPGTTHASGTYDEDGEEPVIPGGYYKGDTPGESKYGGPVTKYRMNFLIPDIHQSGLMWFHSHAHSLSSQQVNSGLSGAIIIKGNEDYYGQFSKPKGPLLVQQKGELELPSDGEEFPANSLRPEIKQQVMLFKDFTNRYLGKKENCFLLNSQVNPKITIKPGEIQLWRVGNIGSEKYMNIALETVKNLNGDSLSPNDWNQEIKSDSYTIMNNGDGSKMTIPDTIPIEEIPITFKKDSCQEGDDECREYHGNLIFNVNPLSDGVTVTNSEKDSVNKSVNKNNRQANFTIDNDVDNPNVVFQQDPEEFDPAEFKINQVKLELNEFVLASGYKVRGNIKDGDGNKSSKVMASIDGVAFTGYFDFEDNNKYSFTTTEITNPEEIPISEFAEPWDNPNFYILARDGDVVEHPVATNSILLPPGARAEFLVVGGQASDKYYLVSDLSSHMTEKDQDLGNNKNISYILATVETVADEAVSEYDYTNTIDPTSSVTTNSVTCKVSADGGVDEDCTEEGNTEEGNTVIDLDHFIRNSAPFKVDKILPTPSDLAEFESCDSPSGGISLSNLRNIRNKLVRSIPNKIPEASPDDLKNIFDQLPGLCVNAPDKYKDPLTKKRYFYFSGADGKNFLKGFENSQLFESPKETDIATYPPKYYNIDKDQIKEAFDGNRIDKISHIGDIEDWHLVNTDDISHVFHIHQLDFLVTKATFAGDAENPPETYNNYTVKSCENKELPYRSNQGEAVPGIECELETQGYRDVINLPPHSETVVRIPFVNPFITGVFVYHCHILEHEDNGMMHNIKVINPKGYREIDMKAFKELIRGAIENSKENS